MGRRSQGAAVLLGMLLLCVTATGAAHAEDSGAHAATRAVAGPESPGTETVSVAAPRDGAVVVCPDPAGVAAGCGPSAAPLSAAGLLVLVFGLVGTALVAIRPLEPHRG